MSEMVERVAKAIAKDQQWPDWTNATLVARAAIDAMREPTDDQRNAYFELSHRTDVMMDAHWERAVEAALGEKL